MCCPRGATSSCMNRCSNSRNNGMKNVRGTSALRRHVTLCRNSGSTKQSAQKTAVNTFPAKWRLALTTWTIFGCAPKPTLILAAGQDFFEFQSTQKAADEAKRRYTALGKPEQTGPFSFNDKHSFSKPRHQAAVQH